MRILTDRRLLTATTRTWSPRGRASESHFLHFCSLQVSSLSRALPHPLQDPGALSEDAQCCPIPYGWGDPGRVYIPAQESISPRSKGHVVTDVLSPGEAGSFWALGEVSIQGTWVSLHMYFT